MSSELCRMWCRLRTQSEWQMMPYEPRSYADCLIILKHYEKTWGEFYHYEITPDNNFCRPQSITA